MLLWLRDQLTPGQRWTATLAAALAVALLVAGLPGEPRSESDAPPLAAAAGAGDDAPRDPGSDPGSGPAAAPADAGRVSEHTEPPPRGFTPPPATPTAPSAPAGTPPAGGPAPSAQAEPPPTRPRPSEPPRVAAIVRAGGALPGRDDAAIAEAFLERSALDAEVFALADDEDSGLCPTVAASASVVVAGEGLPGALRDCLTSAGVAIVAFDHLGDLPPTTMGGQVLSSRRGVADGLVDLARWARGNETLSGDIGLVATEPLSAAVEAALPALERLGVRVVATAYLEEDATGGDVGAEVLDFAGEGVEVVVLALPSALQRQWVERHSLVNPAVRYVVADAYDAVVEEFYPVLFDGAVALTATRVPWHTREHGETMEQERCEGIWTESAGVPLVLGAVERVRVLAWCQHVELVGEAVAAAAAGTPVAEALRALTYPALLTSPLSPLADAGWGPTEDAVVVWSAGCRCWQGSEPFAPRASEDA